MTRRTTVKRVQLITVTRVLVPPHNHPTEATGVPVGVVKLDSSARLLVDGHQGRFCMLFDVRVNRVIQLIRAHEAEIRTQFLAHSILFTDWQLRWVD
jgi:hypothetical protein